MNYCRSCGKELPDGRVSFCSAVCYNRWHHATYSFISDGALDLMEYLEETK